MKINFVYIILLFFCIQNIQAQSVSEYKIEDCIIGSIGCSKVFLKDSKIKLKNIYNKQYVVTFISQYQKQDVKNKPAIDFYLSLKDFK